MPQPQFEPLQPVVASWLEKIRLGCEKKAARFGKDAAEGMAFLTGPMEWLFGTGKRDDRHFRQAEPDDGDDEIPPPRFQMTVNKTAELVQLFGPVLYHRNPIRQVNPREYPLPPEDLFHAFGSDPSLGMMLQQMDVQARTSRATDQARSVLLAGYLNYTPNALDLKTEARWAIDEAIIKGMGTLWTEVYTGPAGVKMVGSFFDSVDNLVIDPDATSWRDARWIARKRTLPTWMAERRFGYQPGQLKGQAESYDAQADVTAGGSEGDYERRIGQTQDLITFWEVYSKCGMGGRLKGVEPWVRPVLESYGDFCYLAVCEGYTHPLNVPTGVFELPEAAGRAAIAQQTQWPTPYWADDSWPCTPIYFHTIPKDPWPMSHLAPGMGELKFLNWAYSFIAGKIRTSCRDFVAIMSEAGDDLKNTILHGQDYELVEIKRSAGQTIDQIVKFLQHPEFNADIWTVIDRVSDQFDKRVGLTELVYGESSRQLRSAAEADLKSNAINVRPDEMANRVEDAMGQLARQEALAVRLHLKSQDVVNILGPLAAYLWDFLVTAASPTEVLYSLEYRIEAGSAKKPNKERDRANLEAALQQFMPFFQQIYASLGNPTPFNALVTAWAKTIDLDPAPFLLAPPPAPLAAQAPPAGGGGGGGGNPSPTPQPGAAA